MGGRGAGGRRPGAEGPQACRGGREGSRERAPASEEASGLPPIVGRGGPGAAGVREEARRARGRLLLGAEARIRAGAGALIAKSSAFVAT